MEANIIEGTLKLCQETNRKQVCGADEPQGGALVPSGRERDRIGVASSSLSGFRKNNQTCWIRDNRMLEVLNGNNS